MGLIIVNASLQRRPPEFYQTMPKLGRICVAFHYSHFGNQCETGSIPIYHSYQIISPLFCWSLKRVDKNYTNIKRLVKR
jgi:hypothetical protein